ncbi:MAG: bifunctional folylpolyglutamate synthase/dihydrofolate synthase [Cellvibrionaceae bacterium]
MPQPLTRNSSLAQWLAYLEQLHPSEIDLGLIRIKDVAEKLGLLTFDCPVISIAGTNGKGTCVAAFEVMAKAQGKHIGSYTSPHLLRYNERIRIDGEPVDDQRIVDSFVAIEEVRGKTSLTYFEFGTLAALYIFKQHELEQTGHQQPCLDAIALEVGLGGRLDAVNIIDADIAIVTSVAKDHEDWLGSDIGGIAREKAGIFRRWKAAITGVRIGEEPEPVLREVANSIEADYVCHGKDFFAVQLDEGWQYESPYNSVWLPDTELVKSNLACVLNAWETLNWPLTNAEQAMGNLSVPGRLQKVSVNWPGEDKQPREKKLLLDVAHNPAAAKHLGEYLQAGERKRAAVFAVMADKDITEVVAPILPSIEEWFVAGLPHMPRAEQPDQLKSIIEATARALEISALEISTLSNDNVTSFDSVSDALKAALDSTADEIVVFGSFFTVEAALNCIKEIAQE